MKLDNLVKGGVVPVTDLLLKKDYESYRLPENHILFLGTQIHKRLIEEVDFKELQGYVRSSESFSMKASLEECVYVNRKDRKLVDIVQLAKKNSVYREYNLLEALLLSRMIIDNHCNKVGSEVILLLEKRKTEYYSTITIMYTRKKTFIVYAFDMPPEMTLSVGDSIVLKKL